MKLENKKVIITGGAMGIGLATAKRLLAENAIVTIWDINQKELDNCKILFKAYENRIFLHNCDVSDKDKIHEMTQVALTEMGGIDILINNAGYVAGGSLIDTDNDKWDKTIKINLNAIVYTTKEILPILLKQDRGHIVNLSSASSYLGVPDLAVYTATKWAVWGFTESIRFEIINSGKKNVGISSIHPSYLATGMFEGAKLGFLGNLIVPQVKDHDVIAKAIVNGALKKGKYAVRRPRSLRLSMILRGILPDKLFQYMLIVMGVHKSMSNWKGR